MFFRYIGAVTGGIRTDPLNWANEAGTVYSGTTYPGDTADREDDVVLDSAATYALAGGAFTNRLRSFRVTTGYVTAAGAALDIGTTGAYLDMLAGTVSIETMGNVYIQGTAGAGLENVRVGSVASGKKVYIKGVFANFSPADGAVDIITAATVTGTFVVGGDPNGRPIVTIPAGVTTPTIVLVRGGTLTSSSALSNPVLESGALVQTLGDITTLETYGGICTWNGGNITTIKAYGGQVNASGSVGVRRVGDIYCYTGAQVQLDNKVGSVRVTGRIHNMGGTVNYALGSPVEQYLVPTYAGAADAKIGISPISKADTETEWGTDIYVGMYDRLEVLCSVGARDGSVGFQLYKGVVAAGSPPTGYTAITDPAAITMATANTTKKITLWGYQLLGLSNVRVKATVTGGAASLISATYQVYRA
jgi:hypothetical protein